LKNEITTCLIFIKSKTSTKTPGTWIKTIPLGMVQCFLGYDYRYASSACLFLLHLVEKRLEAQVVL